MRKSRLLFNTEFTGLSTGYSNYYRELMTQLYGMEKYEMAEMASYFKESDSMQQQQASKIPWKLYGVMPNNPQEEAVYNSNPVAEFGSFKFDPVCLDWQPDIVCDIRDNWMMQFIDQSPFRRLFKTVFMPTVDANQQAAEWIDNYQRADYVLNYTEFGQNVLREESGNTINCRGLAPAAVDTTIFKPIQNKRQHKTQFNIRPDSIIIGMVARNQRRKLYPELAKSFVDFLHKLNLENTENVFLYFHTAHPDLGFDIPHIVKQNGLSHKILFTFLCHNCNYFAPTFYQDVRAVCPRCKQGSFTFAHSQKGIDRESLASVYQLMDLYVQYVSNEGQGIPQVEAAVCGVPVTGTNYSGTESIIKNVGGHPISPFLYFTETETNRTLVFPNNDELVEYIQEFTAMPESMRNRLGYLTHLKAINHYGDWSKIAKVWESIFDEITIQEPSAWKTTPIDYIDINTFPLCPGYDRMNDEQFVSWLCTEVLRRSDWAGTHVGLKMMRDLHYGRTVKGQMGFMSNDSSLIGGRLAWDVLDRDKLYDQVKGMRNHWNQLEIERYNRIQQGVIK